MTIAIVDVVVGVIIAAYLAGCAWVVRREGALLAVKVMSWVGAVILLAAFAVVAVTRAAAL